MPSLTLYSKEIRASTGPSPKRPEPIDELATGAYAFAVGESRTIMVELLGQRLSLKTEFDSDQAREAEAHVRRKLEFLRERSGQIQSDKLALVAALQIAGELLEERRQLAELRRSVRERSRQLLAGIDAVGRELELADDVHTEVS